ncbi:MAG: hypothetical protein A2V21_300760 [Deltaproteobacteria bacterium GWC2_55_46]|nr:MAG: hypothetical protein A2Z79_10445 [Deltaproteobacteria bacterium GWA2_55_82]OGQ63043.1 MAG: hypothetical protein A3I81_06525 [Deltaproteobacteria bacterium RIFCSPLOWO2_02_FULL_55_12]OIJ74990.1 MAG: hypothetical protein A2V21_300760 [Deltaproteobacteria bacterium GWC2_55_46]
MPEKYRQGVFGDKLALKAMPGLKVSVFYAGSPGARFMAADKSGTIYLSVPEDGVVLALPDRDGDGAADEPVTFARGLKRPHGLVFKDRALIVAETGRLVELKDENGDLKADSTRVISRDLPSGGGHWTKSIDIGPDNAIYVSTGSSCNACIEKDRRRAAVVRFKDSGKAEIFASGLRNSVGIEFHPKTGELWGVDNGRDGLGDDIPPEELNRIELGGDYGWPFCYGKKQPDTDFGSAERCKDTVPPAVEMQAHSAPLGVAFGYSLKFPERLRNVLYIAFHGSWNRSVPTGYKVIAIPFGDGKPSGKPFDVITGWLSGGEAWGRPVDALVGRDGALYISDDKAGAVYRVTYGGD